MRLRCLAVSAAPRSRSSDCTRMGWHKTGVERSISSRHILAHEGHATEQTVPGHEPHLKRSAASALLETTGAGTLWAALTDALAVCPEPLSR